MKKLENQNNQPAGPIQGILWILGVALGILGLFALAFNLLGLFLRFF